MVVVVAAGVCFVEVIRVLDSTAAMIKVETTNGLMVLVVARVVVGGLCG